MKKWLLFSALIWTLPARAQTPAVGQKIEYRRDLPKSVARLMPRGAKSLFWGVFQDGKNAAPKAIHLFSAHPQIDLSKAPLLHRADEMSRRKYHLTLDVFEQKSGKFIRLNRVPVGYRASIWGPIHVEANFSWIDWRRQMPLLRLLCFTKDGHYAGVPVGDAVFLSFSEGWKKNTTLQSAYYGDNSTFYQFQRRGRENLEIVRDDGSMNIGNDANGHDILAITVFRWSGRKFVVTPETAEMLGPYEKQWKP